MAQIQKKQQEKMDFQKSREQYRKKELERKRKEVLFFHKVGVDSVLLG